MRQPSDVQIGRWFRTFRLGLDLSQRETAKLLGVPRSAVSLIESGKRKLTVSEAVALLFYEDTGEWSRSSKG